MLIARELLRSLRGDVEALSAQRLGHAREVELLGLERPFQ
jgi:hypothetical protein